MKKKKSTQQEKEDALGLTERDEAINYKQRWFAEHVNLIRVTNGVSVPRTDAARSCRAEDRQRKRMR